MFNVHKDRSDVTKFKNLEEEYKDLDNTRVLLTDCKCSSGIDTGILMNKQTPGLKKESKKNRGKGKKKMLKTMRYRDNTGVFFRKND